MEENGFVGGCLLFILFLCMNKWRIKSELIVCVCERERERERRWEKFHLGSGKDFTWYR